MTKVVYIEQVNELARLIIAGTERRYDLGMRLMALGITGISDEATRNIGGPLWLIWGNLTDRVDGPRGAEPGAEDAASAVMVQAATEWLSASSDEALRRQYLQHWVYDVCGYKHGPNIPDF
jgi:hypothetical protein